MEELEQKHSTEPNFLMVIFWERIKNQNTLAAFTAGFLEVNKMNFAAFDCFIFHDVDLVPENERNLYRCNPSYPKRFVWSRELNKYRLGHKEGVGTIVSGFLILFQIRIEHGRIIARCDTPSCPYCFINF
jgi:glycosyltransferase involved in cell wall biosynthesis